MKFELTITMATPSLNKYAFSHWRTQYRDKQEWHAALLVASRQAGATKATGKRRITVLRCGRKMLDIDNAIGGLKPILDGMRKLELLVDDDRHNLDLVMLQQQVKSAKDVHTKITIEDL
jgi:hypothetical protein